MTSIQFLLSILQKFSFPALNLFYTLNSWRRPLIIHRCNIYIFIYWLYCIKYYCCNSFFLFCYTLTTTTQIKTKSVTTAAQMRPLKSELHTLTLGGSCNAKLAEWEIGKSEGDHMLCCPVTITKLQTVVFRALI